MLLQNTSFRKWFATLITRKYILLNMSCSMMIQKTKLWKCLRTLIQLITWNSDHKEKVSLQYGFFCTFSKSNWQIMFSGTDDKKKVSPQNGFFFWVFKLLPRLNDLGRWSHKFFFTSMGSSVNLQTATVTKWFGTLITRKVSWQYEFFCASSNCFCQKMT